MARPEAKPEAKADTKSEIKSETKSETKSAPESEAYPNDDAAEPVLAQPVPGDGEPEAKPEAESETASERSVPYACMQPAILVQLTATTHAGLHVRAHPYEVYHVYWSGSNKQRY